MMKPGTSLRAVSFVATLLVALSFALPATAAEESKDYLNASPEIIAKWRDLKFGLFVHWGPVSLEGTEIGWSRGGERRGRTGKGSIPVEVYDNLYKKFNPTKFDAKEWVEIAKAAGMQYMVFTTKHHDGFSMFDTKLTDYKITSPESPYGRDVVKELADACHDGGLWWGIYHSPVDWYHPDYRTETHAKYIEFLHGQVRELLTNYGRVDIMWFDGLGGSAEDWDSEPMFKMIRTLQPEIIINNRGGLAGDYDTPEQRIGRMQVDRPWETCMTICRQWAWKPDDQMKSLEECIQTLVKVVGGDGNLLFNVGPMPDGRIEPRQVERLREMGAWLEQHGESIYGTRGGPFRRGPWGTATHKDSTIYLHLLDPEMDTVVLPPIEKKILDASLLTGGTVTINQTDESIEVCVPEADRRQIDTIVVLVLDGPAAEANPGRLASDSVAAGKPATASNVYRNMTYQYGPAMAFDDDPETRWATDVGTHQAWLEVDLGAPQTIDRATIREAYAHRVAKFELQAKEGDGWATFAQGGRIGEELTIRFQPVTAQVIRLNILQATEGPTIWEFQLLPVKKEK
jgi:alpha-L-fucosidase